MKLNTRVLIQLGAYALLATCVMGCSKPAAPPERLDRFPRATLGAWYVGMYPYVTEVRVHPLSVGPRSLSFQDVQLTSLAVTCEDVTSCTFAGTKTGTNWREYCDGTLLFVNGQVTVTSRFDAQANDANKAAGRSSFVPYDSEHTHNELENCDDMSRSYSRPPEGVIAGQSPAAAGGGGGGADNACMMRCATAQSSCVLSCSGAESCITQCGAKSLTCVGECS